MNDISQDIHHEPTQHNNRNTAQLTEQKTHQTCEQQDISNEKIVHKEQQAMGQDQSNELYKEKLEEYTSIILQMNKERLQLEKQLSDCKKELSMVRTYLGCVFLA